MVARRANRERARARAAGVRRRHACGDRDGHRRCSSRRRALPAGAAIWMSLAGLNGAIDRSRRTLPYARRTDGRAGRRERRRRCSSVRSLAGHPVARRDRDLRRRHCSVASRAAWIDVGPGLRRDDSRHVRDCRRAAVRQRSTARSFARRSSLAGGAWAMVHRDSSSGRFGRTVPFDCASPSAIARSRDTWKRRRSTSMLGRTIRRRSPRTSSRCERRSNRRAPSLGDARVADGRVESGRGERLLVLHEIADQMLRAPGRAARVSAPTLRRRRSTTNDSCSSATLDEGRATIRAIGHVDRSRRSTSRTSIDRLGRRRDFGRRVDGLADRRPHSPTTPAASRSISSAR